jgi:hypothetical protein
MVTETWPFTFLAGQEQPCYTFCMKLDHFASHRQKYIIFFVIAVLVTYATYVVIRSEAQGYPFMQNYEEEGNGRKCPLSLRYLPRLFFSRHPCMRAPVEPVIVPSSQESVSEVSTTTEATSTPTGATTDATTTISSTGDSTPTSTSTDETSITTEVAASSSNPQ